MDGHYKAELVGGPDRLGPWKTIEELELAILAWVHRHDNERLHGYLGDVPSAEFEETVDTAEAPGESLGRKHDSGVSVKQSTIQAGLALDKIRTSLTTVLQDFWETAFLKKRLLTHAEQIPV